MKELVLRHLRRTTLAIMASAMLLAFFVGPAHSMLQLPERPDGRTKVDTPADLRKEEGWQKVHGPHPSHEVVSHKSTRTFTPPQGNPQAVLAVTKGMAHLKGGLTPPKPNESAPNHAMTIGILLVLSAGIFAAARTYIKKLDSESK